jgi:dienelactone hydrolase
MKLSHCIASLVLCLLISAVVHGDEASFPYPNHADLSRYLDASGQLQPIRTNVDWETRRQHILANVQRVMGPLPKADSRVPLDVKSVEETRAGKLVRRKITFQSDAADRVPAWVMFLDSPQSSKRPAVLCLHQTTAVGKDEPAGIRGDAELKYALELAERGYIVIAPDYPSFGEHPYDFKSQQAYASGSMKAVSDNIRAVDVLQSLPEVDRDRIGVIGHSLGGHSAMFTALFDERLKAIVSSCGFTTFRKDDLPSWTGQRYMPRIATDFKNDVKLVPFDFDEIVAAFAPRAFLACAAEQDDDFDVTGVKEVIANARPVYERLGVPNNLAAHYPPTRHAFPIEARATAYQFLDRVLKPDAPQ